MNPDIKLTYKFDRIVILGAGGTGSILIPFLIRYLISQKYLGEIIIVDGDKYDPKNIDRQLFTLSMVGTNKAEYQAKFIKSSFPHLVNEVHYVPLYLSLENVKDIIEEKTLVINCTDNKAARKIAEDRCMQLNTAAHICCGNEKVNGQVQINVRIDGKNITPSIYERSPKFNSLSDDRSLMSCDELSKLPSGGQIICANMMASAIALNYVTYLINANDNLNIYQDGKWIPCDTVWFDCSMNSFLSEGRQELIFNKTKEKELVANAN